MERIPVLAASLQYAQHAVLLSAPDKRPKKGADGSAASKPPPGRSNGNTGLLPLGPAVDNATAEGTEQKVGRPDSPRRAAPPLPSFSDAEEDAVDVLCVDAPQATADTPATRLPACLAAQQDSLQGIGDRERVAAAAAAMEMDSRTACALSLIHI